MSSSRPFPEIVDGAEWTARRSTDPLEAYVDLSERIIVTPDETFESLNAENIRALRAHELLHVRHSPIIDVPADIPRRVIGATEDGRIHTIANVQGIDGLLEALPTTAVDRQGVRLAIQRGDATEAAAMLTCGAGVRRGADIRRALEQYAADGNETAVEALARADRAIAELQARPFDPQSAIRAARALLSDPDEDGEDDKDEDDKDEDDKDEDDNDEDDKDDNDKDDNDKDDNDNDEDDEDDNDEDDKDEDAAPKVPTYRYNPREQSPHQYTSGDETDWQQLDAPIPTRRPVAVSVNAMRKTRPAFSSGPTVSAAARSVTDGRVFGRVKTGRGGTVLVDWSGSTNFTNEDLDRIVRAIPAATVAIYSGSRFAIVADKGRRAEQPPFNLGRNASDLPALEWLARQPEPRMWISDGYVTVQRDRSPSRRQCDDVDRLCKSARIARAECGTDRRGNRLPRHWLDALPYLRAGRTPPSAVPYAIHADD